MDSERVYEAVPSRSQVIDQWSITGFKDSRDYTYVCMYDKVYGAAPRARENVVYTVYTVY